ncbi:probable inactive tRNA-specific adenosine deaminase-like protein 3 [Harmonia axyridis]|uniref:probable inactive tRNA-specific adenosine deaminase-like protein 3 n=1 Tax=Harmonia axyridis TaxID=115357 RepID=UPI001E275675|nr:probable inactive tRNA-specific adenosine deaminase-like protein 3 [Harmonia axyridis]
MSKNIKVKSVLDSSLVEDIPLIEVFVDFVTDPRNISKVVLELNARCPTPELNHLKRVKARQVLLFPSADIKDEEVFSILKDKGFPVDLLKNEVHRVKVAASPPLVRQQYVKCHSAWPCNFHADKYLEKLHTNTLFQGEELKQISIFMDIAEEVGHYFCSSSGVVIVDPKINSVVAVGFNERPELTIRHSIMVAIDNVAKTQMGGAWSTADNSCDPKNENVNLNGIPENILVKLKEKYCSVNFGASVFTPKNGDPEGPYLCTGYDVFTIHEPCVMCAMALIHSRAKRVFYRMPSVNGALGSLCKIHTVKELNHHYEVFIVEEENINSSS